MVKALKNNPRSQESNLPFWKDKSISQQFGIKVKNNLFVSLPDVLGMLKHSPTSRLTRNRSRAEGKDPRWHPGAVTSCPLAEWPWQSPWPRHGSIRPRRLGRKDAVCCPGAHSSSNPEKATALLIPALLIRNYNSCGIWQWKHARLPCLVWLFSLFCLYFWFSCK